MASRERVIAMVQEAFARGEYPGDGFLQGSYEGSEPFEVAEAFRGQREWQTLDAEFLDAQSTALSFFSEAALRFYLPAFLIADLRGELQYVDVLFPLTHGFREGSVEIEMGDQKFLRHFGRSAHVNPRRFGAMTWEDYARYRLSIFSREEARAIVAFLEYRYEQVDEGLDREAIEAALDSFWRERAATAPTAAELHTVLEEEARFLKAISPDSHGREQA